MDCSYHVIFAHVLFLREINKPVRNDTSLSVSLSDSNEYDPSRIPLCLAKDGVVELNSWLRGGAREEGERGEGKGGSRGASFLGGGPTLRFGLLGGGWECCGGEVSIHFLSSSSSSSDDEAHIQVFTLITLDSSVPLSP